MKNAPRSLARVATPGNARELVAFALGTTAARVEERCRELRCGTAASLADAVRARARRELRVRRDEARGTLVITVELPLETGELVDKAIDRALEATAASGPEFAEESWAAQRADALVAMAKDYLDGQRARTSGTPDHYQVTVHVDEAASAEARDVPRCRSKPSGASPATATSSCWSRTATA